MSEQGKKLAEHLKASGDTEASKLVEMFDQVVDNQKACVESVAKILRQQETIMTLIDRLTTRIVKLESYR